METEDKKEEILEFIRSNPGLTFRQIRFNLGTELYGENHLQFNEGTLNKALISLIKSGFVRKDDERRYWKNG